MKMKMLIIAIGCIVIAGAVATGCDSARQKVLNTEQKVRDANKSLAVIRKEKRDEAHKMKMEKEMGQFLAECELVIESNNKQIDEIKKAILTNEKGYNTVYVDRVNELKAENEELREKICEYQIESEVSVWDEFKTEISQDMRNISEAFKDLAINNTN